MPLPSASASNFYSWPADKIFGFKEYEENDLPELFQDDLKTVMAIGEHGNLSRAADALGINHSTLFRRLGAIETSLALALFLRRRTHYVPTKAGTALIALGHRIEEDIHYVLQNIEEDECGFRGR